MGRLKAVVASLDGVPEAFRDLYKKVGDEYRLDAEGVEFADDVAGLRKALDTERNTRKELERKYGTIDPEKYQEMLDAEEARKREAAEKKGEWDRLREALEKKHSQAQEKWMSRERALLGAIEKLTVDAGLAAELERVGVKKELRPAVQALLKSRGARLVEDGDDFRAVLKLDGIERPLKEAVDEWARSDEAAHYLPPRGTGGSGAETGKGSAGTGTQRAPNGKPLVAPGSIAANAEALLKGDAEPMPINIG